MNLLHLLDHRSATLTRAMRKITRLQRRNKTIHGQHISHLGIKVPQFDSYMPYWIYRQRHCSADNANHYWWYFPLHARLILRSVPITVDGVDGYLYYLPHPIDDDIRRDWKDAGFYFFPKNSDFLVLKGGFDCPSLPPVPVWYPLDSLTVPGQDGKDIQLYLDHDSEMHTNLPGGVPWKLIIDAKQWKLLDWYLQRGNRYYGDGLTDDDGWHKRSTLNRVHHRGTPRHGRVIPWDRDVKRQIRKALQDTDVYPSFTKYFCDCPKDKWPPCSSCRIAFDPDRCFPVDDD